jgi:uncharacterized protein
MSVHVKLTLDLLKSRYALCRLDPFAGVPTWAARGDFWSITRNDQEVTVFCEEEAIPQQVESERGWRTLQLEGPISFTQTGILDSVVEPLSHAHISILVVSAYDTNYVLLKDNVLEQAITVLTECGHTIKR